MFSIDPKVCFWLFIVDSADARAAQPRLSHREEVINLVDIDIVPLVSA